MCDQEAGVMLLCFTIHGSDNYTYLKHENNRGIDRLPPRYYVLRWMVTTSQVKILRTGDPTLSLEFSEINRLNMKAK